MTASSIPRAAPPATSGDSLDLDLVDNDRVVGWMTSGTVGFCGFASEQDAAYAAWAVHAATTRRRAQKDGGIPKLAVREPLTLQTEPDGRRYVYTSSQRIARLLAPGTGSRSGDSYGFELPSEDAGDEVSIRAHAHLAYRALRQSESSG